MSFTTALVSLALLTLGMVGIEIMFTYATRGFAFGFSSNRDPATEYSQLALRIKRAYQNQVESSAYLVPVLAAAAISGLQSESAEIAALVAVAGRTIFAILYYTGLPFLRVVGFVMGTLSTLFIVYVLLTSGVL